MRTLPPTSRSNWVSRSAVAQVTMVSALESMDEALSHRMTRAIEQETPSVSNAGLPFARAGNIRNGFQFSDAECFRGRRTCQRKVVGRKISQQRRFTVFTSKGTVGRFAFVKKDTPRFVYLKPTALLLDLSFGGHTMR